MTKRTKNPAPPSMVDAKPVERWKSCSICRPIPAASSEFWKGGETEGPGLPANSIKLEIIGWPYYDDSTSSSNSCIKRCPECGTCYQWSTEYEYLVNGSEDDIHLTRLSDEEGNKAVKLVLEAVDRAKQKFHNDGQACIPLLDAFDKTSGVVEVKKVTNASRFFYHYQLVYREDISFAIPALVKALLNHNHTPPKCDVGRELYWVLRDFANKAPANKKRILTLLGDLKFQETPLEVQDLIKDCIAVK
nr:hypothetical protein [Candidatus Sigynarchaeota archaeon]